MVNKIVYILIINFFLFKCSNGNKKCLTISNLVDHLKSQNKYTDKIKQYITENWELTNDISDLLEDIDIEKENSLLFENANNDEQTYNTQKQLIKNAFAEILNNNNKQINTINNRTKNIQTPFKKCTKIGDLIEVTLNRNNINEKNIILKGIIIDIIKKNKNTKIKIKRTNSTNTYTFFISEINKIKWQNKHDNVIQINENKNTIKKNIITDKRLNMILKHLLPPENYIYKNIN